MGEVRERGAYRSRRGEEAASTAARAGGRIVGSGLWRKKVGSEGLRKAGGNLVEELYLRGEACVPDPNHGRLTRSGRTTGAPGLGLGPFAEATKAWS